jgi:hypothetical protein
MSTTSTRSGEGMRKVGYAEGKEYTLEQQSAQGDLARLPTLASHWSH